MATKTVNVYYIGTRPILDTVQGANGVMEEASTLLGHYDVGTDAIYHTLQVQHDPAVVDGLLATNDYGSGDANFPDGYYDEGFSNTVSGGFSELDSQQLFLGTVTYRDIDGVVKTMDNVSFNVYQLENGDTYLAPTAEIVSPTSGLAGDSGEFTASVLSGRDILSIELDTLRNDAIGHDNLIYDFESAQDTVQTFYLGNKAILDTTQGNGKMEGADALLGSYDATADMPVDGQFTLHTLSIRHDAAANDGLLATNDYGASAYYPDGYYDEGFSNAPTAGQNGTTFSELDSQQLFWGDVYYIDADGLEQVMHNVGLNVYQLENGDVFAVPTREIVSENGTFADANDTSPSVLAGLSISRIELTSLRLDPIGNDNLIYDSESIGQGNLEASLALTSSSTGDQNCDDDIIFAGAGNDTVDGGLGDDVVDGGTGNDSLTGGDGADTLLGGEGSDTLVGGEGADLMDGGAGDDDIAVGGLDTALGGAGDDVFTLDATDPAADMNVTLDGGRDATDGSPDDVANGDAGDVLDLGDQAGDLTVALGTDPEMGTVDGLDLDVDADITFSDIEKVVTGSGNDTIDGGASTGSVDVVTGAGDDVITTGSGDDVIDAGAGADTVNAGAGDDTVLGGAGDDVLDGGLGDDVVDGGAGDDSLTGGDGADTLNGGDGSDTLAGGEGADLLDGGAGDDDIAVGGSDTAFGGSGDDVFTLDGTDPAADVNVTLDGGTDATDGSPDDAANGDAGDVLDLGDQTGDLTVALGTDPETGTVDGLDADTDADISFTEIENIVTGSGNDTIDGGAATGPVDVATGAGDDSIATGSGDDTLDAGTGNDTVSSGAGDDSVDAGAGDDLVDAGSGNDTVAAGDGNDTVDGGAGDDSLDGGMGNDSLTGGDGADTLLGREGSDTLVGGEGADLLDGGAGDDDIAVGAGDTALGGDGDDVFAVDTALSGTDPITITGGEGAEEDVIDPTNNPDGRVGDVLDLTGKTIVSLTYDETDPTWDGTTSESGTVVILNDLGEEVAIQFSEIEHILRDVGAVDGTDGDDVMDPGYADQQGDQVDGADGDNDTILGNGGNDSIDAGAGSDVVDGGADNDTIDGGAGDDTVLGGAGDDVLDGGLGDDVVDGGAGDDSLTGGDGADTLNGGDGSDTLAGGEGADLLDGGAGDDDIAVGGLDTALGGSGDDVFTLDGTDPAADVNVTLDGGTDATDGSPDDAANGDAGDVLDLGDQTGDLTVALGTDPETGTVDGLDVDVDADITFSDIENVITGSGNDTIDGGASTGPVDVVTGAGDDVITTGSGDDVIDAGAGADTVDAGAGDDTVNLGIMDGIADTVVLSDGDGSDIVVGFADPVLDSNGQPVTPNDLLDVSDLTDEDGNAVDVGNVIVTVDLDGNPVLSFPNGESVTLQGSDPTIYLDPVTGETNYDALAAIGIPDNRDGIVHGTVDSDVMAPGFVDAQGDIIDGFDGLDDTIRGEAGDDTIDGGLGDDIIYAGIGDDSILGGVGNDTIFGSEGSDTVDGGDGDDFINTRTSPGLGIPDTGLIHPSDPTLSYPADFDPNNDKDVVFGGAGNDTILTGDDADIIYGGSGNDLVDAGFDADLVYGDAGIDSIQGSEGCDTIYGGDDNDVIYGGVSPLDPNYELAQNYDLTDDIDTDPSNNMDLLFGGSGDDRIYGQDDADILYGDEGNDVLDGGIDDDSLYGGAGDDTLIGGEGGDSIFGGDGADIIQGVTSGDVIDGGTGGDDRDVLDLRGSAPTDGRFKVTITSTDPDGDSQSGLITFYDANNIVTGTANFTEIESIVPCFTPGTMIVTKFGQKPAELIRAGDFVLTRDNGFREVSWAGSKVVDPSALLENTNLRPVLVKAGALGRGMPELDTMFSPNHRVLCSGSAFEIYFGEAEVLVPVKYLVGQPGISIALPHVGTKYVHFMFDCHEVVFGNGCWSESFQPGEQALNGVGEEQRNEILGLFPEIAINQKNLAFGSARRILKRYEVSLLRKSL